MMQNSQRKNNVKAIPRRKRVLADSIADKLCPGEAHSSLFYVFRTRIESYILGSRQVGDNSSRTASNFQNAITGPGLYVLAHQNSAALGSADDIEKQLVRLWQGKN